MPIELQNFSWWVALAIFAGVGGLVVLLGWWSLAGLGRSRKWVAIGVRLCVVALLILILGGARWQRKHDALEVIVLNDASTSVERVGNFPGRGQGVATVRQALDKFYRGLSQDPTKQKPDRIGLISFGKYARVDSVPNTELRLDIKASWDGGANAGTDIGAAIQLALATMSPDAMHRLVLVSDGNANLGDLTAAADAAKAQNVPIDVVPLAYDVKNDVSVERLTAPEWRGEDEPFDLAVGLRSTNAKPVTGTLRVQHLTADGEAYVDLDPSTPELDAGRRVTLQPGPNTQYVRVPPQASSGVHRFKATFTPDDPTDGRSVDEIGGNNTAQSFTFVRGEGKVLFVDGSARPGAGQSLGDTLYGTLVKELSPKVDGPAPKAYDPVRRITVGEFPTTLADLQSYNAVVLYNVPKGGAAENGFVAGLSNDQDAMLKSYVHDLGGGLLVVGGPEAFGAGGWTGSEVEKVLPVNMEIPAQRNVGKGALVLVMHSCEMPQGNYWGEQCAIEAVKTLSVRDEVGVISYGNGLNANQGIGGAQWDVPLREVSNKADINDRIKQMQLGDMPSFDDAINLALNGAGTNKGLLNSKARHKHIIVISDGDPSSPQAPLLQACVTGKVSISTVTVYPHMPGQQRPPTMEEMAGKTKGKAYGPIEADPKQLPQIFIKEAQVVKRSLIQESEAGIPITHIDKGDEMIASIGSFPPVFGLVLTSRKNDPKVMMPLATGALRDPILAYWQSGLGKSAVWTPDAHGQWGAAWVPTPGYATLFGQIVRKIQRPKMSADYDVKTKIEGTHGEVTVQAMDKDAAFASFLNIAGNIVGGKKLDETQQLRFVQVGPGTYKATFNANEGGVYVAALNVAKDGKAEPLLTGTVKNDDVESQTLRSNEAAMQQVAERTGGRVLAAFDPTGAEVFTRVGVTPGFSLKQIWDLLLPWLLALIIVDVAVRRIAWDYQSLRRMAITAGERVRAYTSVRQGESKATLEALSRKREEVAETRFGQAGGTPAGGGAGGAKRAAGVPPVPVAGATAGGRPDPKAKFTVAGGKAVEGDISQVVGGATNKPLPTAPKNQQPKGGQPGAPSDALGGLMAAKKRAQQQIKDKEKGDQP